MRYKYSSGATVFSAPPPLAQPVTLSPQAMPGQIMTLKTAFRADSYRSPLRYPGGKQRAAKAIADILDLRLPANSKIASPFFGGGSVELELASRGHRITGSDFFAPVAAFWQQLKSDPLQLKAQIREWCGAADEGPLPQITKNQFYLLQTELRTLLERLKDLGSGHDMTEQQRFELAWRFFVINRSSFSGSTLSGGMASGDRFNAAAIDRLMPVNTSGLTVKHGDYWDQLFDRKRRRFTFDAIYADPPYALDCSKLYGDKGSTHDAFDHARFAGHMWSLSTKYNVPILISYNDCPTVRDLFKGWRFEPIAWAYGMNASKKSNEILISNF